MSEKTTEISFEVDAAEASVLDGYCNAKGIKRTVVMRRLLKEWSDEKLHEAISILRVTGVKPEATGSNRKVSE
jgi:DNA integrity scanning protein DisA with diadenylate cyclase activity